MASFFEWAVAQSDKWDPSNISSPANAEELDSMTLEAYCQNTFLAWVDGSRTR
jgi:hypothetical protein